MGQPNWTPDGKTRTVDVRPSNTWISTVTMRGERDVLEVDLTAINPAPAFLLMSSPIKVRLLEVT